MVPKLEPNLHEKVKSPHDFLALAMHGRVVSKPWLKNFRCLLPEQLCQWKERDAVQRHQEGITLRDALLAQEDEGHLARPPAHQACLVPVTIESKPAQLGVPVAHRPQHARTVQHVEAILGINKQKDFLQVLLRHPIQLFF
jgi:hypothetical protein